MIKLKKAARLFMDFFEIYLPSAVFLSMFVVFLINLIWRYVFRNPQNWTMEFSINSFVIIGLLGACVAHRMEDHVVFDLLYASVGQKGKTVLRILSNLLIALFISLALPGTIKYLWQHPAITAIMKIPQNIIFSSFAILLIFSAVRSAYRLVQDVKSLLNATYEQTYNTEEKESLI